LVYRFVCCSATIMQIVTFLTRLVSPE